jgi:hypothetical protein
MPSCVLPIACAYCAAVASQVTRQSQPRAGEEGGGCSRKEKGRGGQEGQEVTRCNGARAEEGRWCLACFPPAALPQELFPVVNIANRLFVSFFCMRVSSVQDVRAAPPAADVPSALCDSSFTNRTEKNLIEGRFKVSRGARGRPPKLNRV